MTSKKIIESLTKFVVFSFAMITIYTITAIIFQATTGQELSNTLTTCFYGAFAGELLMCAFIKIFKIKGDKNE